METSSFHRGKPYAWIPTSFSATSLDVGLFACAPVQQSLLSESVTFDSLSSKSSDVPPAYPPLKLPSMRTIGLGDRLKLFSLGGSGRHLNSTVLISTPTTPRLKTMLKECLSIAKWVETCAAWQAPGHIPWEGTQESFVESWIPEGSVFSPECFALALSQSRTSRNKALTCLERPWPPELSSKIHEFDAAKFASQDSMETNVLDMMRELTSIRSFFQEPPQDSQTNAPSQHVGEPAKLSLPSLVVSTSQFTFPIALESSYSLSSSLASRRGKKAPPHLQVMKEKETQKTQELPYPGIPTAFLGSPSRHRPQLQYTKSHDEPALHFEEMITNLRLQCSTMSLRTPQDISFNSRSFLDSELVSHDGAIDHATTKVEGDEWAFAQTLLKDYKFPPPPQTHAWSKAMYSDSPRAPSVHHALYGKRRSAHVFVPSNAYDVEKMKTAIKTTAETCKPSSNSHNSAAGVIKSVESGLLQLKSTSPPLVRSTMARKRISGTRTSLTRKPLKRVRFVLAHQEVRKGPAFAAAMDEETKTELPSRKDAIQDLPSTTPRLARSSSLSAWRKARTATLSSPHRRSIVSKIFAESDAGKPNRAIFRRSTQSLGRHSLSRIIKGPIFSGRDSKRATISSISIKGNIKVDENAVRKESESLNKRSRLPVPLRSILTRFK